MRASRQANQPRKAGEVRNTSSTWRGKGHFTWGEVSRLNKGDARPVFTLCSFPLSSHMTQVTSRSLSTLPCGALWSWSALLPAQCSSCFSSSSSFSLSLTIISVFITTARGWTWKIPPVRCASPKTRRSRISSTISPHRGLAQVLSSSGFVAVVGLRHRFPAG